MAADIAQESPQSARLLYRWLMVVESTLNHVLRGEKYALYEYLTAITRPEILIKQYKSYTTNNVIHTCNTF